MIKIFYKITNYFVIDLPDYFILIQIFINIIIHIILPCKSKIICYLLLFINYFLLFLNNLIHFFLIFYKLFIFSFFLSRLTYCDSRLSCSFKNNFFSILIILFNLQLSVNQLVMNQQLDAFIFFMKFFKNSFLYQFKFYLFVIIPFLTFLG